MYSLTLGFQQFKFLPISTTISLITSIQDQTNNVSQMSMKAAYMTATAIVLAIPIFHKLKSKLENRKIIQDGSLSGQNSICFHHIMESAELVLRRALMMKNGSLEFHSLEVTTLSSIMTMNQSV